MSDQPDQPTTTATSSAGNTPFAVTRDRFAPGTIVGGRYRIVGLLGAGGMGEVFRADDLKLAQPIALKFLPRELVRDPAALARFHSEVRTARQVSHPNVCRVFDIGESDGQHFLSMEYVDGEDLASLLRRIGRVPPDKALDIARQLCAGLSAAHTAGVLHRDLKPANVMLDGRGRVRITDFGLAIHPAHVAGDPSFAGTPAYMSPEQAAGHRLTSASDIYALGLVLYEIFTGRRPFAGRTAGEVLRAQSGSAPVTPSSHIRDLDPKIERVILACLEKDPRDRPASALVVSTGLTGGDPLQEAIAAGETPSPEMVAAAGRQVGMRPSRAALCLLALVVSAAFVLAVGPHTNVFSAAPPEDSPEILRRKARDISAAVGYPQRPADTWAVLHHDQDYLAHVEASSGSDWWRRLLHERPSPIRLSYRESPLPLRSWRMNGSGRVSVRDPPATVPGMVTLELDGVGRLRTFSAVPSQTENSSATSRDLDPALLFTYAGLNRSDFVQAAPPSGSPAALQMWTGTYPGQNGPPVRVAMSQDRGRLILFKVEEPWVGTVPAGAAGERAGSLFISAVLASIVVGAAWLAFTNVRRGRGDRRGALRLAAFVSVVSVVSWLLSADHVAGMEEQLLLTQALRESLFEGGTIWLLYLALEPYVRRRWPQTLIAWSRLLEGRFGDPLVGRDVLIGLTSAMALHVLDRAMAFWARDGAAVELIAAGMLWPLSSLNRFAGWVIESLMFVEVAMGLFFLMVVVRAVFRKDWLAAAALLLIAALPGVLSGQPHLTLSATIYVTTLYLLSIRIGLLALATAGWIGHLLSLPLTADPNAWHAGYAYALVAVPVLLGSITFVYAKAGQRLGRLDLLH
jgi:hypothetical protein